MTTNFYFFGIFGKTRRIYTTFLFVLLMFYSYSQTNNNHFVGRVNVPFVQKCRNITLQFDSPLPDFNYYIMLEGTCFGKPMMSKSSRLLVINPAAYVISANAVQPACHYETGRIDIDLQNNLSGNNSLKKYISIDNINFKQVFDKEILIAERGITNYTIRNLATGNYFVYLADNNDCRSNVASVTITTPPALSVNFSTINVSGVQYNNGVPDTVSDGSIEINLVQNYVDSYQILTNTQNLPLGGGKMIIAYNSGQCRDSFDFKIGLNPVKLQVEVRESAEVSCYGLGDAVLSPVIVKDRYLSKSYKWYKFQNGNFVLVGTNENLTNVAAGSYRLECYSGGLRSIFDYVVNQPTHFNVVTSMISDPSCHDYEDGKIAITASGGISPYTLLWNTGETSDSIKNLSAGFYKCWATDAHGCRDSVMVSLMNFPPVTVEVDASIAFCNNSVGKIVLTTRGGVPDYSYYWNGELGSAVLSNAAGDIYHYEVKDGHGCLAEGYVDIRDPNIVEMRTSKKIVKNLQVVPNPVNDILTFSCHTDSQVDLRWQLISSKTGRVVLEGYLLANGKTQYVIDVSLLPAGIYVLVVEKEIVVVAII